METLSPNPQPRALHPDDHQLSGPFPIYLVIGLVLLFAGCSPTRGNDEWTTARYRGLMLLAIALTEESTPQEEIEATNCKCTGAECSCSDDCACNHCRNQPTVEAKKSSPKTVLYFTARWCIPCQRWRQRELPALRKQGWNDRWITIIDIDQNPDLRQQYNINVVPTFLVLQDKQERSRRIGSIDAVTFANWVNDL